MRDLSEHLRQALSAFGLDAGKDASAVRFGHGLIHDTWRVDLAQGIFIAQRLNADVFAEPSVVAENAAQAARLIDAALRRRNDGNPHRRLVYSRSPDGKPWVLDQAGQTWRISSLIERSRPADPGSLDEVKQAARALGRLPGLLADGDGPPSRVVLPGFHDTATHLSRLVETIENNPRGRVATCNREIDSILAASSLSKILPRLGLPERVVHNDAKLDNVLVDADDGSVLCVVDLDTVQAGLAAHDFGDLVRSAVTGLPEDEINLDRIRVQLPVFQCLAEGYLKGAAEWITPDEMESLLDGVIVMVFEQAVRFLADFLAGDVYYSVNDGEHNLRRARAQIRLLQDVMVRERELRRLLAVF